MCVQALAKLPEYLGSWNGRWATNLANLPTNSSVVVPAQSADFLVLGFCLSGWCIFMRRARISVARPFCPSVVPIHVALAMLRCDVLIFEESTKEVIRIFFLGVIVFVVVFGLSLIAVRLLYGPSGFESWYGKFCLSWSSFWFGLYVAKLWKSKWCVLAPSYQRPLSSTLENDENPSLKRPLLGSMGGGE